MTNANTIGDIIQKISQDHGEKKLLDAQFTLAVFTDLAPNLKKEKELLRSFLLCNGAEKILQVKNASFQDQKRCIDGLVKSMEDDHWVATEAARLICSEFYRGVTNQEWKFEMPPAKQPKGYSPHHSGGSVPPFNAGKKLLFIGAALVIVVLVFIGVGTYSANKPLSNGMTQDEGAEILAQGIAFYDAGDYESAIECFVQLPSDSKQYSEAQSTLEKCEDEYSASVIEKANGYAANGEYEMAINFLTNVGELLPNNAAISTAYDTIFAEYKGVVCNTAHSEAETFASDGDYLSAITAIDNAAKLIGHDDELAARRDVYVDAYVSQAVSAAEAQYIEYNYESIIAAEDILEAALKVLPDNERLLTELANYKEREPVRLLDLPFSSDAAGKSGHMYSFKETGPVRDVSGIDYDYSIAPSGWFETSHPYGWSPTYSAACYYWLLDYQYSKVTGVLIFDETYKNASIDIELMVAPSHGTTQTYFSSNTSQPQQFEVDLSGSKDFSIRIEQSEINGTYAYLADVYVWK